MAVGAHTVIKEILDLLIPGVKGDLPGGDTFTQREYCSFFTPLHHDVTFHCN